MAVRSLFAALAWSFLIQPTGVALAVDSDPRSAAPTPAPTLAPTPAFEQYREVPTPPNVQVVMTELEGPVFATEEGLTLYKWPQHKLRNGYSGEPPGIPACYGQPKLTTAGLMSPYPAGVPLPDRDQRPACTDLWRPFFAKADAQPVGKWTVLERKDARLQWAFDEQALYTSARDQQAGDTFGGTRRKHDGDSPAIRVPIGPPPLVPPGVAVKTTSIGRLLTTTKNESLYAYEGESAAALHCTEQCLKQFSPLKAPALAKPIGEWSIIEREAGVRQWAFRDSPVYTHPDDTHSWSLEGSDEAGWVNLFTQRAPAPPGSFTVQETLAGLVLADSAGKSIYVYRCGDDSMDQLACDHPNDTQVYRLAMCGGGDAERCRAFWPYVPATEGEISTSRAWSVVSIDPKTGHYAREGDDDAVRVWAYRQRPVYTYSGDVLAGDLNGAGTGEWRGKRNGLLAFWLRDDFMEGIE